MEPFNVDDLQYNDLVMVEAIVTRCIPKTWTRETAQNANLVATFELQAVNLLERTTQKRRAQLAHASVSI